MSVERRQQRIREERKRHFELTVNHPPGGGGLRVLTGHALSERCIHSIHLLVVGYCDHRALQRGHSNCRASHVPMTAVLEPHFTNCDLLAYSSHCNNDGA